MGIEPIYRSGEQKINVELEKNWTDGHKEPEPNN